MPVTYEIDQSSSIVRTRCIGNVTFAEVLDHLRTLERDARRPETLDVLLDLCELASMPQPDQLRAVSEEIGLLQPVVRFRACALVASRDVVFGYARMFEAFAASRFEATRVCRGREEAEEWLASRGKGAPGELEEG
jgi:hypothetical protein